MLRNRSSYVKTIILGISCVSLLLLSACSKDVKDADAQVPTPSNEISTLQDEKITIHRPGETPETYGKLSSGIRKDIEFIYSNVTRGFYGEKVEDSSLTKIIKASADEKDKSEVI